MKRISFFVLLAALIVSCQDKRMNRQVGKERVANSKKDTIRSSSLGTNELLVEQKGNLSKVIPKGFRLNSEYDADLNQDSTEDKLLIVEVDDSLSAVALSAIFPDTFNLDTTPLLILIRQPNGLLEQVARNDEVIYDIKSHAETGNGLTEISFDNGTFTIVYFYHPGGSHRTVSYSFRYDPQQRDWLLKEYVYSRTSDAMSDSGGYDDTHEVIKNQRDFGQISFSNFKLSDVE